MEAKHQIVHRRQHGFTLFELFVVCAIIGVLATFALGRLWAMQQMAEETMAEQVLGALKDGIRIRSAELISANHWDEFRNLPQNNPFNWLEDLPGNYRGELKGEGQVGYWYFDPVKRTATYFVKQADDFRSADGTKTMHFVVVGLDGNGRIHKEPPFAWLGLRPQSDYVWLGRTLR